VRTSHPVRFVSSCLCFTPLSVTIASFGLLAFLGFRPTPARASDWPPILPEELALKDNPAEPGSDAMILYREQLADGTRAYETLYYRIKVFTKEGKKYADVEIPFLKGREDISEIHARTIHTDGQVAEFDGKVYEKVVVKAGSIKVDEKSFSLPDVTPGSIIEYRYRVQRDPDYIWNTFWRVQEGMYTKHAHFTYKPYAGASAPMLYMRTFLLGPELRPQKQRNGDFTMDLDNLAGVPEEDYMLPVDELRGRVEFMYAWDPISQNPDEFWNNVGKKWYGQESSFIGKHSEVKQAADQAIAGADSPEARLRKLYTRAQQVKNTQMEDDRSAQEEKRDKEKDNTNVADVLKRGYGTGSDINRLFIAFAQAEGFDAGSVWAAPRNEGIFHKDLEDSRELDDEFVWVHAGDKDYFLDPAVTLCPFGMVPWYENGLSVLRPTKQGAVFMNVPMSPSSQAVLHRDADLVADDQGNFKGTFKLTAMGDKALDWRSDGRSKDEAARKKMMLDYVKQWFPADAKIELTALNNWDNIDEPLEVDCTVETRLLEGAGHRALLSADIFTSGRPQKFEHEVRKQSIYFVYPYEESDSIRIQVPMLWKVESLPSAKTMDPGGNLHYEISASEQGAFLTIKRREVVGSILYPASSYGAIRNFFGQVKTDDEQQAVFQSALASGRN
jgi:Domain of Unknown Function with PDB structure (DUF3857)